MLAIIIDPIPKPRMTRSDRWRKRKCVVDYFNFKANVLNQIGGQKETTGFLSVEFILKMPKSWSKKKKKEMYGKPHTCRPDLDNLTKALKDTLYQEDSAIHSYMEPFVKKWGETGSINIYSY